MASHSELASLGLRGNMKSILILLLLTGPVYGKPLSTSTDFDFCVADNRLACKKVQLPSDMGWPVTVYFEKDFYPTKSGKGVGMQFKMGNSPDKMETYCIGSPLKVERKSELITFTGKFMCLDGTGGTDEVTFDSKAMTLSNDGGEPYSCQCEEY